MSCIDERKHFIFTTAGNFFQPLSEEKEEILNKNICLDNFLEDSGCFILTMKISMDSQLSLENKLPPGEGKETVLVFFKIRPEVVTEENMRHIVFVASMPDSPVVALYHTVQRVFAPTLLKDDRWSQAVEPKLQAMLTDLESNLRSLVLRAQEESISPSAKLTEIMSVEDELQFWIGCGNQSKKKSEQQRAKGFVEALDLLSKTMRQLDTIEVGDSDDVLENAHAAMDDLWKLDEYKYPQDRMEHLMEIIGKLLTRFVQKKIKAESIWEEDFIEIEALLSQCLSVCNKWIQMCERLTTLFWPNHSLHRWVGLPYRPYHLAKFSIRLKEQLKTCTRCNYSRISHIQPWYNGLLQISDSLSDQLLHSSLRHQKALQA